MTTLTGSPTRSRNNAFLDRYVQSLSPEKPLKPFSPSKLNSSINLRNDLKVSAAAPSNKEKVERTWSSTPSKKYQVQLNSTNSDPSTFGLSFDMSSLSKDEKAYYEFLCRVGEVKRWIETVTEQKLPSELDLCVGDGLRNGVYLALLTQKINPDLAPTVFPAGEKLQFKHTQNINTFFSLVDHVGLPESFRFELQDLYNKKDLPQVFETLYILITIISKKWPLKTPPLQSLSGQLSFSKEHLQRCKRAWPRIRDFKSLNVSPMNSPVARKAGPALKSGLIEDFKIADKNEIDPEPAILTPIKKSQSIAFPELSPTSEVRSLFASPRSADRSARASPPRLETFGIRGEEVLSTTPLLEYSPSKNVSLSYYSPSVSKYLTYDTDYYRLRSRAREDDLDYYQSFKYGPFDYSPKRKQRMTETEFLDSVIQLQSLSRSVNLRFQLQIQRNLLKIFGKEIIYLQSCIRANHMRSAPYLRLLDQKCLESLRNLQALLKGLDARKSLDICKFKLLKQEGALLKFQSVCKGDVLRKQTKILLDGIEFTKSALVGFQALLRGKLHRTLDKRPSLLLSDLVGLQQLQAICAGKAVRKRQLNLEIELIQVSHIICQLQSHVKGCLKGLAFKPLLASVGKYEKSISRLCGCIRGKKKRFAMKDALCGEYEDLQIMLRLQAITRGILVRYTLDLVDDIIEINNLREMQASLRGHKLRIKLRERSSLFRRNIRSIVLIQSKIRMFLLRNAYLDVMHCPNPSLWSVRKFTHLLNGIGTIEEEQNRLEGCQAQLDSENSRKENLESEIRKQMDMLELLESYGLNPDYVTDSNALAIPKHKFPAFEKLFYLLQVDPSYWKLMYSKDPEFTVRNVYVSFSTVNQKMGSREKALFIRLLAEILQQDMSEARSVRQFLQNTDAPWIKLLRLFLHKEYPDIFTLFLPLLKYLADPEIHFESNPSIIFKELHGFQPPTNVSAVEDEKTSTTFIQNLRNLWHSVELIAMLFSKKVAKIPTEVRFICTKVFCSAADKNADEADMRRAISTVLVRCFCAEYLTQRSHYGFTESSYSNLDRKIEITMDALMTVLSGSRFNNYYDPLNAYSKEINPQVRELLMSTLLDPQYEHDGDAIIYHDMVSANPQLEILSEKVLTISSKFHENLLFFPNDDVIHEILKTLPHYAISNGRIVLDLAPSAYRFLVSDDKTRKLYDQAKRAFVYMTQVEEISTDLYDLALSCVLPQDEPHFEVLIAAHSEIQRDPMIQSLASRSYFELKNATLKKIHELESLGMLNPAGNRLQNFLNDIANTIKDPHYAVSYVIRELDITKQTLLRIRQINKGLESDLVQQKKSIKRVFGNIQQSRSYASHNKSTFGNLKGAYMKTHKKSSEMEGLKFKWTTRQLYEKGVVKSIAGEKLAEQKVKVFGSSGPQFPDIIFKMATSDGVKYGIQLLDKRKGPERKHQDCVDSFNLEELLGAQVESKLSNMKLFGGKVTMSSSALLSLIVSTFLH
ncbi:hypothetical protein HG536_0A08380 [Torulaspora globosa]|uniref:Calponin-homology (CH) domain-containing protein n=1 Tax=Torulaspora globosa TaxID=48254 RepID=A0A7G3ZBY7_9SACH|nr:uncharacterized protein HG536_0A08380 [Torulaspora globosa]QLL31023.1 hypothetical protein HG536_0A08380 [Torulaspora globosa]